MRALSTVSRHLSIDDLEFAVEDKEVCIRSSSRVGDSDFGVNAKRVN